MSANNKAAVTAEGTAPRNIIDGGFERPSERAMRLAEPIYQAIQERALAIAGLTKLEQFVHSQRDLYSSTIARQLNRTERSINQVRARIQKKMAKAFAIASAEKDRLSPESRQAARLMTLDNPVR